jgi:hypothetical protein
LQQWQKSMYSYNAPFSFFFLFFFFCFYFYEYLAPTSSFVQYISHICVSHAHIHTNSLSLCIRFATAQFGRCPRVHCQGQPVLPVGRSDLPRNYTVNIYCPMCQDIYHPKSSRAAAVDGAYFGTTFPNIFLLSRPNLIPAQPTQTYIPRIYGFRINKVLLDVLK